VEQDQHKYFASSFQERMLIHHLRTIQESTTRGRPEPATNNIPAIPMLPSHFLEKGKTMTPQVQSIKIKVKWCLF
jgi:hypothetical protein